MVIKSAFIEECLVKKADLLDNFFSSISTYYCISSENTKSDFT